MKLSGIIFDIDGTLTSTNELIFATFNHVTKRYFNKTYSPDELTALFGPTEDQILYEWFKENYEQARKEYYVFYETMHDKLVKPIDGVVELLHLIQQKQIPLGVFTGKGRTSTEITLNKLEIKKYFDLIITGDDVINHKPAADGIQIFLDKFKLDPRQVLMIGDAPADVIAARSAGTNVASVLWDSFAKEEVLRLGSDLYFNTVEELTDFVIAHI